MNGRWQPTTRRFVAMLVGLGAVVVVALLARSVPGGGNDPGALALETRLLAPCCWNGTLDTHESELAHTLRHEIETRVAQGEKNAAIEADLVSRYGPKIRALPREGALQLVLAVAAVLVIAAGAWGASRVRAWRRTSDDEVRAATPVRERLVDDYDARIDAELADLD